MNKTKYLKGACQHCAGHIEFPAEMIGTATTCPHCGQETELLLAAPKSESTLSGKTVFWSITALIVLGLGLAGALIALKRAEKMVARQKQQANTVAAKSDTNPMNRPHDDGTNLAAQEELSLSPITLEKSPGSSLVYAIGTVKNSSNRQKFGVKVQIALFDGTGQKVGTSTDYRQVLEPMAQWQFKALVVDSKAVSAKLESILEDQ